MSSIEDYLILHEASSYKLTQKVSDWIKRGYKPQGGVAVVEGFDYGGQNWMQAMVKETT